MAMTIAHVSSAPFFGGAARAGFRLHQGLSNRTDCESIWLDAGNNEGSPGITCVKAPLTASLPSRVRRKLWKTGFEKLSPFTETPFSDPDGWGRPEMLERILVPDVWNLHWVSWFMNWEKLLPWMAERAPIVWTLHDMNPFQGIWHYLPQSFERRSQYHDIDVQAIAQKKQALNKIPRDRLTFVGPSRWMRDAVASQDVFKEFPAECIPYGLDTDAFRPVNRNVLRDLCDVSQDSMVLGFLADTVSDPRKGMQPLKEAISIASRSVSIHAVTVGRGELDLSDHCAHTHLGPLQSTTLLRSFYSGCDLFACPSLQDNLPNTVLESLSCGTPVVAFDIGGLPDMVRDGVSGITVPSGEVETLGAAVVQLFQDRSRLDALRSSSRQLAENEYKLDRQAEQYWGLYERSLGRSS